ncbi:MAG: hypothetical protein Q7W45_09515 [Bacteroidota bacterium]|nr:hypothetical protein [Bacteroidota bacterium]MDP3144083.1 hypothetical protein [Bacteroidota bacterium]MDP3558194.1 hypothetical protein [Bacteroidota bacterium]
METKESVRRIPRRIILFSATMLLAISATANTLNLTPNPMKENMFVFYLTAILFFALFLLHIVVSRLTKNNIVFEGDGKVITFRKKRHHYRKVIKKTA